MFKANGACGYVKKPDFLLKTGPHNEVFDPKARLPVKTKLKVSALLLDSLHHYPKALAQIILILMSQVIDIIFFHLKKVTIYMGEGWYYDFRLTHFDAYSPPDFYARVSY